MTNHVNHEPQTMTVVHKRTNPLAVGSLISSLCFFVIGSLVGVILGHLAWRDIKRTGEGGSGLAMAGLIIGYLGLVPVVLVFIFLVIGGGIAAGTA